MTRKKPEREIKKEGVIVPPHVLAQLRAMVNERDRKPKINPYVLANHPPSVFPKGHTTIAMDEAINDSLAWAALQAQQNMFSEGLMFIGYPYLSELAQRPEYRHVTETIATEMTREWIELQSKSKDNKRSAENKKEEEDKDEDGEQDNAGGKNGGNPFSRDDFEEQAPGGPEGEEEEPPQEPEDVDTDELDEEDEEAKKEEEERAERIKQIENEMKRLNVKDSFRRVAEKDGFFGRAHLFLDFGENLGQPGGDPELKTSIGNGNPEDDTAKVKIKKDSLRAVKVVEPIWCYPMQYNARNPLADDWYKPTCWLVQGQEVHATRLLTFVGREVPDILKPAYSFGGLPLSQMVKPYVDNWLRTRQSVSDIVHSFVIYVLSTNLGTITQSNQLIARLDLFNLTRDNKGVMAIDKDTEEFSNVQTSLSGLEQLQAQSLEQISAISKIPLVKLTGISPSGLNATAEGELRCFYDWIKAYQEMFFRPHLTTVINFIQLSLFGKVDEDITFVFKDLWSLDDKQEAEKQKIEMDTDTGWINAGVLHPEEVRKRLASDPEAPYHDIDVSDVPEDQSPSGMPGMDPNATGGMFGNEQEPSEGKMALPHGATAESPFSEDMAYDAAEWVESKHPRGQPGNAGQFGSGGGGGGGQQSGGEQDVGGAGVQPVPAPANSPVHTNPKPPEQDQLEEPRQLTGPEQYVVSKYKNTGYAHINNTLREGTLDKASKSTQEDVATLDKLIAQGSLDEAKTLHRVVIGKNVLKQLKVGSTFQDAAFLSTSTDANKAMRAVEDARGGIKRKDTVTKIELNMPKGHPAFNVEANRVGPSIAGGMGDEGEFLLPRNTKFQVDSIDEETGVVKISPAKDPENMLKFKSLEEYSKFLKTEEQKKANPDMLHFKSLEEYSRFLKSQAEKKKEPEMMHFKSLDEYSKYLKENYPHLAEKKETEEP